MNKDQEEKKPVEKKPGDETPPVQKEARPEVSPQSEPRPTNRTPTRGIFW